MEISGIDLDKEAFGQTLRVLNTLAGLLLVITFPGLSTMPSHQVPTSISVPMRRSCTNSIDGLCLGSAFQQSHINDHRRSVISDDSGRLGRTPLITSKITVGSCFRFEKGFVPV